VEEKKSTDGNEMIGKTRETLLGLTVAGMAHLRYLVLRTRKENSSASGWNHSTSIEGAEKNERSRLAAGATMNESRDRPLAATKSDNNVVQQRCVVEFAERSLRRGNMREFERIFWMVLDSVGIGELPDAAEYGDVAGTRCDTLRNRGRWRFRI